MVVTPEHPLATATKSVSFVRRRVAGLRERLERSGLPESRTDEWVRELDSMDELLDEVEALLRTLQRAYPKLLAES